MGVTCVWLPLGKKAPQLQGGQAAGSAVEGPPMSQEVPLRFPVRTHARGRLLHMLLLRVFLFQSRGKGVRAR